MNCSVWDTMCQEVFVGIGERIAEERKRMGLSQAAFAELVGVSFSSQRRYENETRTPDTEYLSALVDVGVDMDYVFSGQRDIPERWESRANGRIIANIALALNLEPDAFGEATMEAFAQTVAEKAGKGPPPEAYLAEFLDDSLLTVETAIYDAVDRSPRVLDEKLLIKVIEGLEVTSLQQAMVINPAKKAQAIMMLYRTFKASGKVDPAVIEEAVKLAAD